MDRTYVHGLCTILRRIVTVLEGVAEEEEGGIDVVAF